MKRLILVLLSLSLLTFGFAGCAKEVKYADNLDAYAVAMNYRDGFTILQLTDIHWNSGTQVGGEEYGCMQYLKKVINEAKAHAGKIDLIEVTGDTFMLTNENAVRDFIDFMESFEISYAMTWGNHDREGTYNPNWLSKQFEKAEHCVYIEVDNDDVHERCNYVINLTENGETKWQLVQLDSGASYREGAADLSLNYDYIRQDQLDWMTAEHNKAGASVPVICYYHIAQADQRKAFEAIQGGAEGYKSKFFKLEGIADSDYASLTEEAFLANNVKAAFIGHDHNNDWTFTTPSGITYGYGVKSSTELYYTAVEKGDTTGGFAVEEGFDLVGASLVTLKNTAGDFELEHLYLNERDGGDFILWVNYDD